MNFVELRKKLEKCGLLSELETAIEAALCAGRILIDEYGKHVAESKEDGTLVTNADRHSQIFIYDLLSTRFPGYGSLGEEQKKSLSRLTKKDVFIFDPLDNTRDYVDERPYFGVLIGLAREGKSILGVAYNPKSKTLAFAIRGYGSYIIRNIEPPPSEVYNRAYISTNIFKMDYLEGHPVDRLKARPETASITSVTSRSRAGTSAVELQAKISPDKTILRNGSMKILDIALGNEGINLYACPEETPMSEWDLCALSVILEEMGGKITYLDGSPLAFNQIETLNRRGILAASNSELYQIAYARVHHES